MSIDLSRRDVLLASSGSVAGLVLSPVPWKLLADSAIWTQRASSAPEPLRGEVTHRYTACTLCPSGCALRARCVGGQPVSFTGVPGHPVSRGALCPTGFAAHHLPRHPLRLTAPARLARSANSLPRPGAASLAEVVAAASAALEAGRAGGAPVPLAFLDLRPGRAESLGIRRMLAGLPGAVLVRPPRAADATFQAIRERVDGTPGPIGADLSAARLVVGFGAPLLEGWGTPGNLRLLAARRGAAAPADALRVVQVEPRRSPTAENADLWIPVRPGTEAAFALGLANVLLAEGLVPAETLRRARDLDGPESFLGVARRFDAESTARLTGVPAATIVSLAREMARGGALAIGGGAPGSGPLGREEEGALAALNLLLGALGTASPTVLRRDLPSPAPAGPLAPEVGWDEVAAGSVGVLLVGAGPRDAPTWDEVSSRLRPGSSLVVSLSPWLSGLASHAEWAVPGPAPLEALDEALPPEGAPVASWSLAPALLAPPAGATSAASFVAQLVSAAAGRSAVPVAPEPLETLLKGRAEAIAATGRGRVFLPGEAEPIALASAGGGNGLYEKLLAGGTWVDDPVPALRPLPRFALLGSRPGEARRLAKAAELGRSGPAIAEELGPVYRASLAGAPPPALPPRGYVGSSGSFPEPAILGKLSRESGLRKPGNRPRPTAPSAPAREA